jgi:hypothetical protein
MLNRFVNTETPGLGPSNHTPEFMNGYYAGFGACSGQQKEPLQVVPDNSKEEAVLDYNGFNLDCLATTNTSSFAFSIFDIFLISSNSSLSFTFVTIGRCSSSPFLRKPNGIVFVYLIKLCI